MELMTMEDFFSMKDLQQCVEHLLNVCDHAVEECPSEYRSKLFNQSILDAYAFVEDLEKRNLLEKGLV